MSQARSRLQCYIDWILIWLVMAFGEVSEGIVIIIKASLQWAPLVGPVSSHLSLLSQCDKLTKSSE